MTMSVRHLTVRLIDFLSINVHDVMPSGDACNVVPASGGVHDFMPNDERGVVRADIAVMCVKNCRGTSVRK